MTTTLATPDTTLATIQAALPVDTQPYVVGDRPTGLVVVDLINGFCTVGFDSLAPLETNEQISIMVSESDRLARTFVERGWPVIAFLDTHEPGKPEPPYPPHCEKGTGQEELVPELKWLQDNSLATLVRKDCINGFIGSINIDNQRNVLLQWINDNKLEALLVVGICTDICVMDFVLTMLSVRNHNLVPSLKDVLVYDKGCATYNLTAEMVAEYGLPKTAIHPQKIAHHMGLYTMSQRGAIIASSITF